MSFLKTSITSYMSVLTLNSSSLKRHAHFFMGKYFPWTYRIRAAVFRDISQLSSFLGISKDHWKAISHGLYGHLYVYLWFTFSIMHILFLTIYYKFLRVKHLNSALLAYSGIMYIFFTFVVIKYFRQFQLKGAETLK